MLTERTCCKSAEITFVFFVDMVTYFLPRNARYIISTCNIFMLTYKLLISNFNIFMLTCNIIISCILYWFVHIYVYVTYKVKVSFHFCSVNVALISCNPRQYILVVFQLISRSVKKIDAFKAEKNWQNQYIVSCCYIQHLPRILCESRFGWQGDLQSNFVLFD